MDRHSPVQTRFPIETTPPYAPIDDPPLPKMTPLRRPLEGSMQLMAPSGVGDHRSPPANHTRMALVPSTGPCRVPTSAVRCLRSEDLANVAFPNIPVASAIQTP